MTFERLKSAGIAHSSYLIGSGSNAAVICHVGHRSGLGASILPRAGYQEVFNVLGSMKAWSATGLPGYYCLVLEV